MIWAIPAVAAAAYYLLALATTIRWRRPARMRADEPPVSILKPLYGKDARLYAALRSHAVQDYPEFEILFGVGDPNDPALSDVERLKRDYPDCRVRVVVAEARAPNQKMAVLAELARHAKHELLVVSDDDILVEPGYLRSVVAPFANPKTGLVTCLYRAYAWSFPSLLEALGISTEFAPSVMVARLLGVVDFALGSTMALRASTLREIGGFAPLGNYLADDYQLGRRVAGKGYRVEFAAAVVETGGASGTWSGVWEHQLRWSRTIRVSRTAGYYGSVITHATFWALVALVGGQWRVAAVTLAVRLAAGIIAGGVILEDPEVWRWFWLMPLRDLFGLAVWVAGCFGSTVYWRGRKLRVRPDGRITDSL